MVEQTENTVAAPEAQMTDKEINFRRLEDKYQRALAQERAEKEEALRLVREVQLRQNAPEEEEDDATEPYVDHKKLKKQMNKFNQSTQSEIQKAVQTAKIAAKEELKQELWLESNPDFHEVLEHAEKFAQKAPGLAKSILRMPEGFERQRLVYENIKALGIDRPEQKQSTIQEKIDQNRKSPYYQPSGVANAPYAGGGDFSPTGQKTAYEQVQKLKSRLRI